MTVRFADVEHIETEEEKNNKIALKKCSSSHSNVILDVICFQFTIKVQTTQTDMET